MTYFAHPGWLEQRPACDLCDKRGYVIVRWEPTREDPHPTYGPCPNGCPAMKASGELVGYDPDRETGNR